MSRYFPHTPYAEDQPLAHTILTTHVLTRCVTTGAVIGTGLFALCPALARMRRTSPFALPAPPPPSRRPSLPRHHRLQHPLHAWRRVALGLAGRMQGRDDIEWCDCAWRLLESRGQLETDDWTYAGMVLGRGGAAAAAATRGAVRGSPVAALGAVATGSLVDTLGYPGWRYGVNGGKFPEGGEGR
jgi:hypothetical protein